MDLTNEQIENEFKRQVKQALKGYRGSSPVTPFQLLNVADTADKFSSGEHEFFRHCRLCSGIGVDKQFEIINQVLAEEDEKT